MKNPEKYCRIDEYIKGRNQPINDFLKEAGEELFRPRK